MTHIQALHTRVPNRHVIALILSPLLAHMASPVRTNTTIFNFMKTEWTEAQKSKYWPIYPQIAYAEACAIAKRTHDDELRRKMQDALQVEMRRIEEYRRIHNEKKQRCQMHEKSHSMRAAAHAVAYAKSSGLTGSAPQLAPRRDRCTMCRTLSGPSSMVDGKCVMCCVDVGARR